MTQTTLLAPAAAGRTQHPHAARPRRDHRAAPALAPVDDEHLHAAVQRAIAFMREHLADPITADDVARTAHFSKFHFTRVFQRITGQPPGRYLTDLRFARAQELLVTTDLRVIDLSYEVGFASVGTFSTRFRERTGMSPSTFRELHRSFSPHGTDDRRGVAVRQL